ncbi:MAG: TrkH family potassium uptake protein [Pirellulaceae bacterium]
MNLRLVSKLLGVISFLIGGMMLFSLPWAHPALGQRLALNPPPPPSEFETTGLLALLASVGVCLLVGGALMWAGRQATGNFFRKEAMAVVGLSWVLATVLGALPFYFSGTYRKPDVPMSFVDCLFESQSGFSTTGATTISELQEPQLVSHCILFWRSSTHFLGGLGIIVLFVAILGQGSAGKALMRAEMPGPTKEGSHSRMQHTALVFAGIYCGLTAVLALILWCFKEISLFDALCHSFGTMATGGFSTYNGSIGHFQNVWIEYVIILFMVLAGTNFTMLYFLLLRQPGRIWSDLEWRTYMSVIACATALVIAFGVFHQDFVGYSDALRYGLFQVVALMTTTGYCTADFDLWSHFARGALLMIMFVGGCAGSTGGGLKVIRFILFVKILRLETEQAYHPTVVRPLRIGGKPVEDQNLRKNILVYFALITLIFVCSWIFVVTTEPNATWGATGEQEGTVEHKLIDSASAVAATLNNIGPGLGVVGATKNYGDFSWHSQLLFIWLMMIGRLEIFSILVLMLPGFWRTH